MAGADFYLWPGYEEPMAWPISRLRRMACRWRRGTPPASHRWVRHGETGLLAAFPDEAALAMRRTLLSDAALRRKLAEGARAFALGERSMANGAARLGSLLA